MFISLTNNRQQSQRVENQSKDTIGGAARARCRRHRLREIANLPGGAPALPDPHTYLKPQEENCDA